LLGDRQVSIRAIANSRELLEIEDAWNAIINECSKNPFLLSHFVTGLMELRSLHGWTPLVLVVSINNTIVGLAPFVLREKFGVRFSRFIFESAFSPDFISYDKNREISISSSLDYLFKTLQCKFALLILPAESPNFNVLRKVCHAKKIRLWATLTHRHRLVPVMHNWEAFTAQRGGHFKRTLRRIERKLDRAGSWRLKCVEPDENTRADTIKKIRNVDRMSWKEFWRERKGERADQMLELVLKGCSNAAKEPDFKWNVWFLELNDNTLAYSLVLQYKDMAYLSKTSYDQRYKGCFPGIYVQNAAIRDILERKMVQNIDFMTDLPFHRNWTSITLPRVQVILAQRGIFPTITGSVLASSHMRKISRARAISTALRLVRLKDLE